MDGKRHIWTFSEDFSKLTLQSKCELLSYYNSLVQLQLDCKWPLVKGIEGGCLGRYEIVFEIALFYRTKADIVRMVRELSKIIELGEPNITGLEKIPSILDGMTVSAAVVDKIALPKLNV